MICRDCDIAVHLYEPGDGGLDRVAILLANGFAARGLATELWLTRADGPVRHLVAPDVRVRLVPAKTSNRSLALALQVPALRRMVRSVNPLVLISAGNQSNLPVALACRGTATAAVAKITNPIDRPCASRRSAAMRRARFGMTARLSRLTLALSEADAHRYRCWYPRASIAAVRNPYVTDAMCAAPGQGTRDAVPTLVSLGRLVAQKDHVTLLDALARLRDRAWRLDIVGDGPLRNAVAARAAALGVADRITFAGFQPDPLPWLKRADMLIVSSRWEGLPAAPIEAMACGCSVVATDCAPGLTDLLTTAGLPHPTPVGDAAALAAAIAAELDSPRDSAALKAVAAPFTIDASVDDHLRLLRPFL